MRNVFKKSVAVSLCIVLSCFLFIGCSSDYVLKKKSKKLNNYTINLSLDSDTMQVMGYEKFEYKNNTDTILDSLVFHLYPTAFSEDATIKPYSSVSEARCFPNGISYGDIEITQVLENSKNTNYIISGSDNDKLEVDLQKKLDIHDSVCVEIYFNLTIPNCTHRFGYYENNINLANFYPILAMREDGVWDKTPYYSSGDPFYSECANYTVSIDFPENFDAFTSGSLISSEIKNGRKKQVYNALVVRDFAIVLGKNFSVKSNFVGDTKINYVGYAEDTNNEVLSDLASKAVSYFSNIYKKYPYSELNIIKTPFLHGGMEYPGLVMISDTIKEEEELYKVIVHEIAHEWWYGLVGVNETTSAWIDEGLSEFSSALFFGEHKEYNITYESMIEDAVSSYILYVDVIKSINGKINTKMNLPVNEYINEYEYTYMIYIKGTIMFDELASKTQKDKFVKALSKICKNYEFKNISSDEFTESIKRYTKLDTDNFFNGFLNGTAIIGKLH